MGKQLKRLCNRKSNQGSTLLTVILCIAFIAVLGSLMLSVTMTNLQMKIIESKSKENFYSSEKIMDKIRVAVQEGAAEAIKQVYETDVLKNYAFYLSGTEDINIVIKKKVALTFLKNLGDTSSLGVDENAKNIALLASEEIPVKANYFKTNSYLSDVENSAVAYPKMKFEVADSKIRLQNIKISYNNGDYHTAIASDIVVTIPDFSFTNGTGEVNYRMVQPLKDYVLLADKSINSINSPINDEITSIIGNIYAGPGGINIDGLFTKKHTVNINANMIVTRGDIKVKDTASLNIGTVTNPLIWADNILTETSNNYPSGSTLTTDLNINGISVIKDDLALNGRNSNVNLLSGAYIGYTGAHTSEGSSIMINGSGSSLNMAGLSNLILAGRAHVDVSNNSLNKDTEILTGESVAFKSNQKAYLLPEKFITNIQHNPVTQADYSDLTVGAPVIHIDDSTDILYNSYLAATPYKIAAKQTGTTTLRYYYFNFKNGKLADDYFSAFKTKYPNVLTTMAPLSLGNVTLPSTGIISAVGNCMSYDAVNNVMQLTPGLSSDIDKITDPSKALTAKANPDAYLQDEVAQLVLNESVYSGYKNTILQDKSVGALDNLYKQISSILNVDPTKAYNVADDVVSSRIKKGGIAVVIDPSNNIKPATYTDFQKISTDVVFTNTDTTKQSFLGVGGKVTISGGSVFNGFLVVDGNVTIGAHSVFNGFIAATGDIVIEDNAKINGFLVSTGEKGSGTFGNITLGNSVTVNGRLAAVNKINLGQDCTIQLNSAMEDTIAKMFTDEGTILNKIFWCSDMTVNFVMIQATSDLVDLSSMISYENWSKTE